jgi:NAD(P)-dependent dehydrogenase (short-subunit alcohol dehydrogenase family)
MSERAGELEGRTCVVTGGGRGIGAAIAERFAAEGGRVAILELDPELGRDRAERLEAAGAEARAYQVDVADEAAVATAAAAVAGDFGGVDVLVNNAGIGKLGPSLTFPAADFRRSLDVMVTGVFLCSREFGRVLRDGGGGAIVNISSINGLVAFPMRLAYSAAKAAVVSMTKVLATEWAAFGIRVNAIAPGNTRTEMVQEAVDQGLIDMDAYMAHTPLRRLGEPAEIADAVLYLASDRSSFLTGQVIAADGGWTAFGWIPWSGDPEAPGVIDPRRGPANILERKEDDA